MRKRDESALYTDKLMYTLFFDTDFSFWYASEVCN